MSSPRFYSTRIGNALPLGFEVVWNGSFDRTEARAINAEAMAPRRKAMPQDVRPATIDPTSLRPGDRILCYVVTHHAQVHTSRSVADAMAMDVKAMSTWLSRLKDRGVLELADVEPTYTGGRGCAVYRVRPLPSA